MPGLSPEQKSALAALLDDGEEETDEPEEETDEPEEETDEPEEDTGGGDDGGEVVVLRGGRADSFLERFLGVTPAEPAPAKKAAAKAPAKKAAAKAPAKKAAKKAAPPAADPPPTRPKFF